MNEKLRTWLVPAKLDFKDWIILFLIVTSLLTFYLTNQECREIVDIVNDDPCFYCVGGIVFIDNITTGSVENNYNTTDVVFDYEEV